MISFVVSGAVALTTSSSSGPTTTVDPISIGVSCQTPSYAASKLYAVTGGIQYPVRLIAPDSTNPNLNHLIISTNSTCTKCGTVPDRWMLSNQILTANAAGTAYINQDAPAGSSPLFTVTTAISSAKQYPIYCALSSAVPGVLEVYGQADQWSLCAFTSVVPPPTTWEIVYKRSNIQPAGETCKPVALVMQPLGIIDPPPPVTA